MKNLLVYIEAHPLRDSYEEFYSIGSFLGNSLFEKADHYDFNFRIISNNYVVDRLNSEHPNLSSLCIRPTASESLAIEAHATGWDEASIQNWIDLTQGNGEAADLYFNILKRVYEFYKFDMVLLWAENGAVRNFCRMHDIAVVHGELGPTRPPFEETMYFDVNGTNGNAAIRSFPEHLYSRVDVIPPETWVCTKGAKDNNPKKPGIIDSPYTLFLDEYTEQINFPYVYLPLQLADDLNTLQHSIFKNPVDFLEKIIPPILEQGYGLVIKPHPGAVSRPYNLSFESRAIKLAKSYGDKVIVLGRNVDTTRALNFMVNAVAVCTINSSVGYEALLLGKKIFVMGDAAYDVGGNLKADLSDLSNIDSYKVDPVVREQIASLISGHFLFPKSEVAKGEILCEVLRFYYNNNIERSLDNFWDSWLSCMRPGYDMIAKRISAQKEIPNIAGNISYIKSKKGSILEEDLFIYFEGKIDREEITVKAEVDEKAFFGFIDKISHVEGGKSKIIGWALDKNLTPPVSIIVGVNGVFRSMHRVLITRKDVSCFLTSSFGERLNGRPTERSGFQFEVQIGDMDDISLYFISCSGLVKKVQLSEGPLHDV